MIFLNFLSYGIRLINLGRGQLLDLFFGESKSDGVSEAGDSTDGNGDSPAAPKMALLEEDMAHLM